MDRRLQLHDIFLTIIPNVYFQPPENIEMIYPCIIYSRGVVGKQKYADDITYLNRIRYSVTVVDPDPDSELLEKIINLPMCAFERHYTADNLNHDIFNLYY